MGRLSNVPPVEVFVAWRDADYGDGSGWDQLRCVYAYHGRNDRLLYIGKAWGKTVKERWRRAAKPHFWDDLERELGIFEHAVSVGTLALYPGTRLTHQLLCDVESLLIHRLRPWGNVQSIESRIERPGLIVHCRGDWARSRRRFRFRR